MLDHEEKVLALGFPLVPFQWYSLEELYAFAAFLDQCIPDQEWRSQ